MPNPLGERRPLGTMSPLRSKQNFKSTFENKSTVLKIKDIIPERSYSSDLAVLDYPVTKFREMEMLVVGDSKRKILAKVTCVRLHPSKGILEKTKISASNRKDLSLFSNP